MFAAAPLDIIRVIPTQRFKGSLQSRETTCRKPFATMIVAAGSKLATQIFTTPRKSAISLLFTQSAFCLTQRNAHSAFVIAGMRKNFGDVTGV